MLSTMAHNSGFVNDHPLCSNATHEHHGAGHACWLGEVGGRSRKELPEELSRRVTRLQRICETKSALEQKGREEAKEDAEESKPKVRVKPSTISAIRNAASEAIPVQQKNLIESFCRLIGDCLPPLH